MGIRDGRTRSGDSWGCDSARLPGASDSQPESSDPGPDSPILLMEILSDAAAKRLFKAFYAGIGVAATMFLALLGMKLSRRFDDLPSTRPVAKMSWSVAALDFAMLLACLCAFLWRLAVVWRAGLRWERRRLRWTVIFAAQLVCAGVGSVFVVVTNLGVLWSDVDFHKTVYSWFGVIGGTTTNTLMALFVVQARSFNLMVDRAGRPLGDREDALWLDAPWRSHWFIAFYWCFYEGAMFRLYSLTKSGSELKLTADLGAQCKPPQATMQMIITIMALISGYLLLFVCFTRRAFVLFSKRSYLQFRWENIYLRFTFRMVGITLLFGVLSNIFLWLIRMKSCLGYTLASFGFPPIMFALAALVAINTVLVMPVVPSGDWPLRAMPDGPRWQEKPIEHSSEGNVQEDVAEPQPVFCFETAVKLIYWCESIYEYDPEMTQLAPPWDLETGLALYGFTNFEYMSSSLMDAHAILAWSVAGTILLCFRGTYSIANVMADIKIWRAAHPPARGVSWLGTCPLVHKGFLESWKGEDFDQKVLTKLKGVMESTGFDKKNLRILVSGHSLGGAMAVLAANDIARYHKVKHHQLFCYTFGCPRVGNSAFAAEHDSLVPNTWHVVNGLDPIPRMAKFWMLYKRSGRRVIVNDLGDMIISPMFLEFKLSAAFMGKRNIKDHKLASYRKSLSRFAAAQFHGYKSSPGGWEALKVLCAQGDIIKVLWAGRGSIKSLSTLASKLWGKSLRCPGSDHTLEDGVDFQGYK